MDHPVGHQTAKLKIGLRILLPFCYKKKQCAFTEMTTGFSRNFKFAPFFLVLRAKE